MRFAKLVASHPFDVAPPGITVRLLLIREIQINCVQLGKSIHHLIGQGRAVPRIISRTHGDTINNLSKRVLLASGFN